MLSLSQVKHKVQEISGVHPLYHDMCINSCVGFVGPFANLESCPNPDCNEPRYDIVRSAKGRNTTKKPRQQFLTNPIGPQIQAAWRSPESAAEMSYRRKCTEKILEDYKLNGGLPSVLSDWIHGTEYVQAVERGHITEDTTTLLLSLDGAQLYRSKQSDVWMYIWILLDRSAETRYKKQHVLIGGVIPGPTKPKNIDSFLFPGFHHISALMQEGLPIWDAQLNRSFLSKLFLAFLTADGPGMQFINGLVGHSGKFGCRLYCPVKGRHKPGAGHYYPALLRPLGSYNVLGSTHADIDIRNIPTSAETRSIRYHQNLAVLMQSLNPTAYERNRLETGIAKRSIVSALPPHCIFGIPNCFPADIMHLAALNIPDILINLWRGLLACEAPDTKASWDWAIFRNATVWKSHGKIVAAARPYLPGSFDRPPRNPAEKISSGYKAVEFLTYLYGLGPAVLYNVLPSKYWANFCKLVRGIRLVYQRQVTVPQLKEAHQLLVEFAEEFERLYYQQKSTRLHFVRQSIHATTHTAPDSIRIGPYGIVSQFAMERAIGDLGGEIRQPSNPFANLAQRALRRCQVNALKHMVPSLDNLPPSIPRGAIPLNNGYTLLRAAETSASFVSPDEAIAFRQFFASTGSEASESWLQKPLVARWARLRLPNGQIARSLWKESRKTLENLRISRNIRLAVAGQLEFGEIQYLFKLSLMPGDDEQGFAMVSMFSKPDMELFERSHKTVWSCRYLGQENLIVVLVDAIRAVVAVVPHTETAGCQTDDALRGRVFVVEKLGLDVMHMAGVDEVDTE